jgi:HAD superfamily hydrolase (TIGR01509 family)
MLRALIFDFDGLILDTEGPDYQSWCELFDAHGCTMPLESWVTLIGTHTSAFDAYAELERQLGRTVDRDTVRRQRRARYVEMVSMQPLLPGVAELIAAAGASGLALAVASSASRDWVAGHLERLELAAHFASVHCSDDVEVVKPDPALYLAALDALGVAAHEAVAFEDSPNGVTAATRAGIFCVAVPHDLTRNLPLAHADLVIDSLTDLTLPQLAELLANR